MSETQTQSQAGAKAPSFTLGFVKLVVRDLPGMIAFYDRALGLQVAQTIENDDMMEKVLQKPGQQGGAQLILYHHKDGRELTLGDANGPIGFYVRDADQAYAHAVENGATPHREPFDAGGMRVAFVLDPEGHEIEMLSMRR